MTATTIVRCAIYTRKSSEEGLEQEFNSLDAQREAGEAYITSQKAEGWVALPSLYDDGGFSGGNLERPALQRLLADIENGNVDVVVVYKIDRLSRSLMDFAKLVEVFDRKNVTFVSVTQSFNTTNSMGRLTLNVLLSFAQFERELTSERIRDKFAASKKKGMWMGGNPPLGYDIVSRKLIVNEAEAATVRFIFERYLELGNVHALRDDLRARGIVSKSWVSAAGVAHGGKPFDRGGLYCLLRNRAYLGETMHKGTAYPGEHMAIITQELFDAARERMAESRRRQLGKPSAHQDALLYNLIFDEAGIPMMPAYSVKHGSVRYRYYICRPRVGSPVSTNAIRRIPAPALEQLVRTALGRLRLMSIHVGPNDAETVVALIDRITVRSHSLTLSLNRAATISSWQNALDIYDSKSEAALLARCRLDLTSGETLTETATHLVVTLPVRAKFRGGRAGMHTPVSNGRPASQPDASLIKAIARAHRWKEWLLEGRFASIDALATHVGQERRHVGRTLNLAFLAPDLTEAILAGTHPMIVRLAHLLDADIPIAWQDQRAWMRQMTAQIAS